MDLDFQTILQSLVISYPVLLLALTIHEIAHALTANWGGDLTATDQDRLSLNPLVHMDPIGTVLMPIVATVFSGLGFAVFGWAKPVPVDERHFRDMRWNVVVALAGPFSNLLLAIVGAILMSIGFAALQLGEAAGWWVVTPEFMSVALRFCLIYLVINLALCLFNLLPIPPLDGSHVVYHYFIRGRGHLYGAWDMYRRFGLLILLLLIQLPIIIFPLIVLFSALRGIFAPNLPF